MITSLHIKNIGIIDDITVDFNKGLNVLTGETGAGKTLIIDSLAIISGGRFSKEMIRKEQEYCYIELCLYMPQHEKAVEGNIIVTREIYATGRNMCKINGRMVTVTELKEFMSNVIDIHGQQDNQKILNTNSHIQYLDNFSGNNLLKWKQQYQKLYQEYNQIKQELKINYGDDKEKQRKLDLLNYQVEEIQNANLKIGEEEELENQKMKMLNAEKIVQNLEIANQEINDTITDSISTAIRALEKIETLDSRYQQKLENIKSISYDIQEIGIDLIGLKEETDFCQQEQEEIEKRLDLLYSFKRKYGNTVEEILKYQEQVKKEIFEIENLEELRKKLKYDLQQIQEKMLELAKKMDEIRRKNAKILEEKINKELKDLEMKNASINIKLDWEKEYNQNGLNEVEFLIKTNIGEKEKPLVKIASGGEMSRIMLAIKNVLANVDEVPILIFDEIDTGISGIAANAVATKLKSIAKTHQILSVTHLASIAAKGDYNYYISKKVEQKQTKTNIKQLDEEEIIKEIARIASGNITAISIQHAKELRYSTKLAS